MQHLPIWVFPGLSPTEHVSIDPHFNRPSEVEVLCGDASKAEKGLGWKPKTSFKELVKMMVESDLKDAPTEKWLASQPES